MVFPKTMDSWVLVDCEMYSGESLDSWQWVLIHVLQKLKCQFCIKAEQTLDKGIDQRTK